MKNPLDRVDITDCCSIPAGKRCEPSRFGHVRWIHAGHLGEMPWGWRHGVVSSAGDDGWLTVDDLLHDGGARTWHRERAPVGTPDRCTGSGWGCPARSAWSTSP